MRFDPTGVLLDVGLCRDISSLNVVNCGMMTRLPRKDEIEGTELNVILQFAPRNQLSRNPTCVFIDTLEHIADGLDMDPESI